MNINAWTSPERHQFLTSKKYYYHLATQSGDLNYRICVDFAFWSFPHDHFPPLWARGTPIDDTGDGGSNCTDISSRIKLRDLKCRVSNWIDNKSTGHIVPKDELIWMQTNGMAVYAAIADEAVVHQDSRNLFALRRDIRTFQFDSGNLVVVPMNGRMVTHFIESSRESAALYHNKPFNSSNLSHEFLFAQLAWAIIKRAHAIFLEYPDANQKAFNLKAAPLDEDDGDGDEPQQQSGVNRGRKRKCTKRKRPDSPESKDPATYDAHELNKFLDPEGIANPYIRKHNVVSWVRNR